MKSKPRLTRLTLAAACALAFILLDRPAGAPARAVGWWWSSAAEAAGVPGAPLPAFVRFGWCGPPARFTTPERMREYRDAGMDALLPEQVDPWTRENNVRRLDAAASAGLRAWVWDDTLATYDPDTPEGARALDTLVAAYVAHPGFLGFYLGDEPPAGSFTALAKVAHALRARSPGHPTFNDLSGVASFPSREAYVSYVNAFLDTIQPPFLCANYYPFLRGEDRPGFIEQLALMNDLARARAIPWLEVVQLTQHGDYREISEGELRWQAAHVVAYGGSGVGAFTYWTPAPDTVWNWAAGAVTYDGKRTARYDWLARLNRSLASVAAGLQGSRWLATEHAGSVPRGGTPFAPGRLLQGVDGRATIGTFTGPDTRARWIVANPDSSLPQSIGLHLPRGVPLERWDEALAEFHRVPVEQGVATLALDPGGFVLLRLPPGSTGLEPRAGRPALGLGPNPARDRVRITVGGAVGATRIEVLDIGGRRVWSARGGAGDGAWDWAGEGPSGRVGPGIYLVRVEDARGVSVAKLVWQAPR